MNSLHASVLDLPLEQRAEMALKAAVEKAIAERAREGLPVYVWSAGKVVELSAEDLHPTTPTPGVAGAPGLRGRSRRRPSKETGRARKAR